MIAAVNERCRRYIFILTISLDKMNYTRKTLIVIVAVLLALPLAARERKNFDKGWQFTLDEKMTTEQAFKAEGWRVLDLPHDWAIEGDFHAGNPSGAGGGALPGGVGWYKKSFSIDDLSQEYLLEFDGVYMNSTVYVNGKVGSRRQTRLVLPIGAQELKHYLLLWAVKAGGVLIFM